VDWKRVEERESCEEHESRYAPPKPPPHTADADAAAVDAAATAAAAAATPGAARLWVSD